MALIRNLIRDDVLSLIESTTDGENTVDYFDRTGAIEQLIGSEAIMKDLGNKCTVLNRRLTDHFRRKKVRRK